MNDIVTATPEEWAKARAALLTREKELVRLSDDIARQRRAMPWRAVDRQYELMTEHGPKSLPDLFDGCSQLVIHHFMFGPDYDAGCPACSAMADSYNGMLPFLRARDVTMICASRAPIHKLLAYRRRMGWDFTWASSHDSDFNADFGWFKPREEVAAWAADDPPDGPAEFAAQCGAGLVEYVQEQPGVSVFARSGDDVFLTYSTTDRGLEPFMIFYDILDLVPRGRHEDPPEGPWLRRHDEFAIAEADAR
jgi:predicted dithiol-disulfide oxidoreductase (DUF899 family)